MRLLVVGASSSPTCGLRDHAAVMAPALASLGGSTETVWWERDPRWSWRQTHRSAVARLSSLQTTLTAGGHDAVLWHYAVFDYGPRTAWDLRATPIYAPAFARVLAGSGLPLVVLVHESAYPWSRRDQRRNALAAGHRMALLAVVGSADGLIIASRQRERWLASRRWLPSRPTVRIPVCNSLTATPTSASSTGSDGARRIGVLGFGTDDARPDVIVGALRALRDRGQNAELVLLGSPGPDGERAGRWLATARALGCEAALSFTGVVPADELGRALDGVEVVAFPQGSGAGANKSTLGAALAFAKPVVAFTGRDTWDEAVQAGAVLACEPTSGALASRLESLLADERYQARQAVVARAFFDREMDPAVCAGRQLDFIATLAQSR